MNPVLTYAALAIGVVSMVSAAADLDWYMDSHKAQFWVKTLGRNGARVFFFLLGLVLALVGLSMALHGRQ